MHTKEPGIYRYAGCKSRFPSEDGFTQVPGFTPMLICKFASQSSRPEKIRDWISYLEQLNERHGSDSEARRTLERLLDEARSWEREIAFA